MEVASFPACPSGKWDFTSPCTLDFLRGLVPSIIILASLATWIPIPQKAKHKLRNVIDILQDRTSLENISPESVKLVVKRYKFVGTTLWRQAVLVIGGLTGSVWWAVAWGRSILQVQDASQGQEAAVWKVVYTGLTLLSWIYLLLLPLLKPKRTPQYSLFLAYIAHLALSVISLCSVFYVRAVQGHYPPRATDASFLAGEILTIVIASSTIASTLTLQVVDEFLLKELPEPQVDDKVTLSQWLTFSWVDPVIKLGYDHDLAEKEIPPLSHSMRAKETYNTLRSYKSSSLLVRLLRANSLDILLDISLTFVSVICNYASPFLIKRILDAIEDPNPASRARAYVYAVLALLASVGKAQSDLFHLWHGRRSGLRIRSSLIASIYDKALRRKDASAVVDQEAAKASPSLTNQQQKKKKAEESPKQAADSGRVVSLMASDSSRIEMVMSGLYFVVGGIMELPVAAVFLYKLLGYSAFVGFIVMVIASPLTSLFMKRYYKIQQEAAKARDKRITVMNEIIGSIKFIKFFGWTESWKEKALAARRVEMNLWIKNTINGILFNMVYIIGPMAVTLISFSWFIFVAKGKLTVSIAFTSLSLFSMIRQPLNTIPQFGVMMSQAYVSVKRINDFLDEDEVPDWVSSLKRPKPDTNAPVQTRIGFKEADFKWNTGVSQDTKAEETNKVSANTVNGEAAADGSDDAAVEEVYPFELLDLNVTFPTGKLSVISGPTGAGKSAILLALLGEMDCVRGESFLPKERTQVDPISGLRNSVAYCSQIPWLQHKTIKENILFGERYDEERYYQTLEACALVPDLEVLDDGDETEVGVRGVSLSGGQQARLALARAVYSRNAHVLLDDILAAVDAHVGRHLLEKCLKGPLMSNRTVILVSHHIELLMPHTDFLVRILDGRIECSGTPKQLRQQGLLDSLMATELVEADAQQSNDSDAHEPSGQDSQVTKPKDNHTRDILDKKTRPGRKLVKDEERASGNVKWATYKTYLVASTWTIWGITVILLICAQMAVLGERWWLKVWGEAYRQPVNGSEASVSYTGHLIGHPDSHHQHLFMMSFGNQTSETVNESTWPNANLHPGYYVAGLLFINIASFCISILSSINASIGTYKAANNIHDSMLDNVVRSTVRFFDTTPSGRIINRFSKDIETIDNSLSNTLRQVLSNVATLIGAVGLVAYILPGFLLPAAVIAYGFYYLTVRYLSTSRSMRRIEATRRSPIFSGFSEVLDGISIVRAFGVEQMFTSRLFTQIDDAGAAFYGLWMCNRWLLYRFDVLGAAAVFLTTILSLSGAVSSGSAGVAILSSQSLVMGVYWISRFWGSLEQDFNSVERANEYLNLPKEPPAVIETHRPPAYWPSNSNKTNFLCVENLSIKYSPELPNVLHDLNFTIRAKERIGVVGRTGSGKSTFAMALLRFVDPSQGRILLDGIDVCSIGLDDLRKNITYIPQEAVLFTGTVRENLDPFGEHTDLELLDVLEKVQLGGNNARSQGGSVAPSRVPSMANLTDAASSITKAVSIVRGKITLDTQVSAGGSSLSAGQRQLLAMARALLRRSNLVLADECSASLDTATDEAIQNTMRSEFSDACVITIAHRLSTIIDYDRLLVLSNGRVQEFDTPWNLLNRDSMFKDMVAQTGHFQELYEAARGGESLRV